MLQQEMPSPVQGAIDRRTAVIDAPALDPQRPARRPAARIQRFLQLRYQSGFDGQVRLIEGRLPGHAPRPRCRELTGDPSRPAKSDLLLVFETAFTPATARTAGREVGDRLIVVSDPAYWR